MKRTAKNAAYLNLLFRRFLLPVLSLLCALPLFPQNARPGSGPAPYFAAAPVPAQSPAVPERTFTLDEVIAALRPTATAEFRWDPFLEGGHFSLGGHTGTFAAAAIAGETGFLLFDNRELFTVPLPYHDKGELVFPEAFVAALGGAFTRTLEEEATRFRIAAIIIDPGHGGKDPGAIGNPVLNGKTTEVVEKDIVLDVSKRLKAVLDRAYPDKQVLMTRSTDVFYSLEERTSMANSVPLNENEAIIYISIHANYVFNQRVRGYEVWYLSPDYRRDLLDPAASPESADVAAIMNAMLEEEFTTESIILAQSILKHLGRNLGSSVPSRGLKAKDWFVVRNSRMPAVLVELGFVSNAADAQLMTGEAGLRKLTDALYNGIIEFVNVFERSGGFTAAR
jgi:N-acetylmuramoyl-L-alanine amidase